MTKCIGLPDIIKNKDHSKNNEKFKDKRKRRKYIKQNPEFINTVDEHMFKMKKILNRLMHLNIFKKMNHTQLVIKMNLYV